MSNVRVRFAPSPTGHLHVGVARTAILNWLFARKNKGSFILRIEDTDQARSTKESENMIIDDLKWLGLKWEEGPDIGGEFGPYRQMERLHLYHQVADELLAKGKAYRCFVSQEEIDENRETKLAEGQSTIFRSPYRDADESVWQKKIADGERFTVRIRVPDDLDSITIHDHIKGEVTFKAETIPEFVLLRADGVPSYNYSVVVDDALMKITHVIRGDDHLTNTPKQILIYQAMGWQIPEFAHIPMILGEDRSKLSKRHGSVSIGQFMEDGYLAEALVNFLSLLGWSSESEDEILSVDRLISEIDLDRVSGSAAVFDRKKLDWMNGTYIRNLPDDVYFTVGKKFLNLAGFPITDEDITQRILVSIRKYLSKFNDIKIHARVFFSDELEYENEEARTMAQTEQSQAIYLAFIDVVKESEKFDLTAFQEMMKQVQKITNIKGKDLWMPFRVGLTGQVHGPDLPIIIEALGKEKCIQRVKQALIKPV